MLTIDCMVLFYVMNELEEHPGLVLHLFFATEIVKEVGISLKIEPTLTFDIEGRK